MGGGGDGSARGSIGLLPSLAFLHFWPGWVFLGRLPCRGTPWLGRVADLFYGAAGVGGVEGCFVVGVCLGQMWHPRHVRNPQGGEVTVSLFVSHPVLPPSLPPSLSSIWMKDKKPGLTLLSCVTKHWWWCLTPCCLPPSLPACSPSLSSQRVSDKKPGLTLSSNVGGG